MVKQNKLQQAALDYASKGIGVFPLVPDDKKPLGSLAPHGGKAATTDEDHIVSSGEQSED
ncbi:MAG: bifunctional DNA primase/polymerase, partial [Planctomycetes bacterium]|nr:bifunctional DNA primase/polymerase [Planctomycetota bacterium]